MEYQRIATAPLRRYADLVAQRQLSATLRGQRPMGVGEVAALEMWLRRRGTEIKSSIEAQQVRGIGEGGLGEAFCGGARGRVRTGGEGLRMGGGEEVAALSGCHAPRVCEDSLAGSGLFIALSLAPHTPTPTLTANPPSAHRRAPVPFLACASWSRSTPGRRRPISRGGPAAAGSGVCSTRSSRRRWSA